ncbi:MAG: uncharacterized protein JWP44_5081 [Mucilaginibacter sp.]|nr:uncharacterized protein [Mucilaginibacter sp.]
MKTYVLYHANCQDGLGAKYAAWKKFGDAATYIPVQYGKPIPEIDADAEVYIVDFSYARDVLDELRSRVEKLVVLDHHKTAEEALRGCEYAHFDMTKSGAVLAWEYFHPNASMPPLLRHIQDRDLWQFKLPGTREITASMSMIGDDMVAWDSLGEQYVLTEAVKNGHAIITYQRHVVENQLANVAVLPFRGLKAGVLNYTNNPSDMGEAIYKSELLGVDFALTYFITADGNPIFSFRSQGDLDVSALAKEFGGGGHKNAAGAPVTLAVLADLLAGKL